MRGQQQPEDKAPNEFRLLTDAELQRLEQAEFVTALADATPTLLVVVETREGRLTRDPVNNAYRALTGFSDAERAQTIFWQSVVAPEDAAAAERAFHAVAGGAKAAPQLSSWQKRDGSTFDCEWTCTPLPRFISHRELFLVTGSDVTERRRQESELRQSRSRIVAAADSERRRLERNLHDGAQQRLVVLSLALRLARTKLRSDPDGADRILTDAAVELSLATKELRELARGLHPAALSDHGLATAVAGLASRAGVPVEVEVTLDGRLPEQVEVALFYVIAEALTNVVKYAQATSAAVRVSRDGQVATASISDDGVGGADAGNGTGLRGLADRVEALDGKLAVESMPGRGTVVTATIPAPR